MTTININERTKAGKTLLELARLLAVSNKGVKIEEKSSYNPEFVEMIKNRDADYNSGKAKSVTVDPNDIWGSLGLQKISEAKADISKHLESGNQSSIKKLPRY